MMKSLWHRFPKSDYEKLISFLQELIQLNEEMVSKKEKKEISKLITSVEKGFKNKKNENLNLSLLIQCLEFLITMVEKDRNLSPRITEIIRHLYSYDRVKKGG